jgi:hypothetical protein
VFEVKPRETWRDVYRFWQIWTSHEWKSERMYLLEIAELNVFAQYACVLFSTKCYKQYNDVRWLSRELFSGVRRRVDWWKFTDASEVLTASIFRTKSTSISCLGLPSDPVEGCGSFLWNVQKNSNRLHCHIPEHRKNRMRRFRWMHHLCLERSDCCLLSCLTCPPWRWRLKVTQKHWSTSTRTDGVSS